MKRNQIEKCRTLRRKETDAEKKLWAILRNRKLAGVKFRRQFPIGGYILDFYASEYGLGIEADGGQHYEDTNKQYDEVRARELSKLDVEIIRFSDRDILTNIEGVYEAIKKAIEKKQSPSPLSSPPRGEDRKIILIQVMYNAVRRKTFRESGGSQRCPTG